LTTPFETTTHKIRQEQIGHQSGMATIAIRKYMDGNQTMMIAGDDLGRPTPMFDQTCGEVPYG